MLVDVKVPVLAESVAEATLMAWHKKPGDTVKRGDSLIDIETDKVTLEVAAPHDGVLAEILKPDGSSVTSDEVIARIENKAGAGAAAKAAPKAEPAPQQQSLPEVPAADPRVGPAVRSLLDEHKLNAAQIKATGPGGRLTKEDVLAHLTRAGASGAASAGAATQAPPARPPAPSRRSIPLRRRRKKGTGVPGAAKNTGCLACPDDTCSADGAARKSGDARPSINFTGNLVVRSGV